MYETDDDVRPVQELLDRTLARANPHLRSTTSSCAGRFTVSTGARAARLRHLCANPACSAVHMHGDRVGITVAST
jgi:tRNA(Phe) wybutosine-synthesizing methylase Tyw3